MRSAPRLARHFGISLIAAWLPACHGSEVSGAEFPFKFREGLLWVEVKLPESERILNFLLDSGAQVSVVNLQTAKELGLRLGQKVLLEQFAAGMP
jgi:hypothetical protein